MAVRQYIGARYVPRFSTVNGGVWDNSYSYEALEIVKHGNDYYTSKIPVPVGMDITNTQYWVKTGDYNGAIGVLDGRVTELDTHVTELETYVTALETQISNEKVINAITIGCDATGENDCSSIINSALSDTDNDDKILYFPKGIYKILSPINLDRNCVCAGTLYTDSNNTIVKIVNKRIVFIFDKIGYATDGNVTSISHNGALNTSLEISSPSNDITAYCRIVGNFINGGTAIKFSANSQFIQNIVLDITFVFGDQHCIECTVPFTSSWVNEIIFDHVSFQCNQNAAIVLSGNSNNVNGWRFIGSSFECASGSIFELNSAKVIIDNCRMSPAEQGSSGNIWSLNNASRLDVYGTYDIPTSRILISDLASVINWVGMLDHNAGCYSKMITKRMDNNEILSFGEKDRCRSKKAIFTFSSNDETIRVGYQYDWEKTMSINTGNYSNATLNIVYDNQHRSGLTSDGEPVCPPLACIVELNGSQPVTIKSSNSIGGAASVTLNPSNGRIFLLQYNRFSVLA